MNTDKQVKILMLRLQHYLNALRENTIPCKLIPYRIYKEINKFLDQFSKYDVDDEGRGIVCDTCHMFIDADENDKGMYYFDVNSGEQYFNEWFLNIELQLIIQKIDNYLNKRPIDYNLYCLPLKRKENK